MTIDSSEYSFFKSHIVERFDYFLPISGKLFFVYKCAILTIIV